MTDNPQHFREQLCTCDYCRYFIREKWGKNRRLAWSCQKGNTPDAWMDFEDCSPSGYVCDDWEMFPDNSESED